ncbi:phospholipid-transporting ATPase 2 isoform X3 [Physcomitrium patens]|uniref:Phospholipid-transporting ATPase n=1 Tax=Physcomitrium patens TaxID=3218 RepID=A0A7I4DXQ3_PHYPA|nr:phospholipid-transporting ATPase 2-like isoform X3 [Physcomitrium patens]|eukprot:XP_024378284.1 phospholipid-transporting ATPase 2-like isoform X3 [Physcomitrella patens]
MKRLVHINDRGGHRDSQNHCSNKISNTKYNIFNFIPKNLWEQFSRFMNKYFLLIATLQLWPLITPVSPVSTWGPLLAIFAVSATKEAWDDYGRYCSDKEFNEKLVWVVKNGVKTRIQAQEIEVGDLVWLLENDEIPCDMVLLGTAEPLGLCYIETAAMDGETDLKTRVIPGPCHGLTSAQLLNIKGMIECPEPDKDILRFDARVRLFPPFPGDELSPLGVKNTLLQCCYLRNTEWACGVAVYTGNETKIGMSKGIAEPKLTAADAMLDKLTTALFICQIVVVMILGLAGNVWNNYEKDKTWYLRFPKKSEWYDFIVIPLRFELLCSIMIPISVKVSLDLAKSVYSKYIDWDIQMYDAVTDTPAKAANTAISEDLGQIEYILTDKTGTLTENMMIFKRCCINGVYYGNFNGDALTDQHLMHSVTEKVSAVVKFVMVMTINNTVVPNMSRENGRLTYKAQSQDEEALVQAAAQLGMVLFSKKGSVVEVNFLGHTMEFEILQVLEFTSDRKRMSVVVRDHSTGGLYLLTKGADETVFRRVRAGEPVQQVADAIDQYSQLGLRTLCFAWRDLDEQEYVAWTAKFNEASAALTDRELKIAEVSELLEKDLELLGASAIEDKLQDGVPETIASLRKAGINFWLLTGDKQTTAIQVARACNFIMAEPEGQLLKIEGSTPSDVADSIEGVLQTFCINNSENKNIAFVIDGLSLEIALKYHKEAFAKLALLIRTALCCRVTPSQKAELVGLVKSCDYRTLAIGDGGNDVKMIQEAHVGVGISGREGLQASRAADYSFGKFKFLKRLILVHGRYSYNRSAFLAQYSIYKSLVICFVQILFSFISGVSGTSLFNSFSLMAYNVAYTSIPVMVTSLLDKDLSERTVMQHPEILYFAQAGRLINPSTFAGWFLRSIFHLFYGVPAFGGVRQRRYLLHTESNPELWEAQWHV